jgi:hypothetical protein
MTEFIRQKIFMWLMRGASGLMTAAERVNPAMVVDYDAVEKQLVELTNTVNAGTETLHGICEDIDTAIDLDRVEQVDEAVTKYLAVRSGIPSPPPRAVLEVCSQPLLIDMFVAVLRFNNARPQKVSIVSTPETPTHATIH